MATTTSFVDQGIASAPKAPARARTIVDDSSPWLALTAPVALALTLVAIIYLSRISF